MKKFSKLAAVACSLIILSSSFAVAQKSQSDSSYRVIEEINSLISSRRCADAESAARLNLRPPLQHTVLGLNELDCRKNKQAAISFLTLAASENETIAIEVLGSMGVSIPPRSRKIVNSVASEAEEPIPAPPPHPMSSLPQPKPKPTVVLVPISPVLVVPHRNPNACIQDGGNIMCLR